MKHGWAFCKTCKSCINVILSLSPQMVSAKSKRGLIKALYMRLAHPEAIDVWYDLTSQFLKSQITILNNNSLFWITILNKPNRKTIRIMSRSAFDAHTGPLFKNLIILNLKSIYKLQIGKFMYQYRSGLLPYSFNNI